MVQHSNEKADSDAGFRAFWGPTVTLMLGLVAGMGLGVLLFQADLDAQAGRAILMLASVPPSPGALEAAGSRAVRGIEEARPVLARPVARALPPPTPVLVRLEGKAEYPRLAKRAGLEGTVDVTVTVDDHGLPAACSASEANRILKQAALDAAATWRFQPATRLGRPVPGTFLIHFEFRLHPKPAQGIAV